MTIKVGINSCGRIGRLILRAAWHWPEFEFIQLNDPAGDAEGTAHLLKFDYNCAARSTKYRLLNTRNKAHEPWNYSTPNHF